MGCTAIDKWLWDSSGFENKKILLKVDCYHLFKQSTWSRSFFLLLTCLVEKVNVTFQRISKFGKGKIWKDWNLQKMGQKAKYREHGALMYSKNVVDI